MPKHPPLNHVQCSHDDTTLFDSSDEDIPSDKLPDKANTTRASPKPISATSFIHVIDSPPPKQAPASSPIGMGTGYSPFFCPLSVDPFFHLIDASSIGHQNQHLPNANHETFSNCDDQSAPTIVYEAASQNLPIDHNTSLLAPDSVSEKEPAIQPVQFGQ